MANNAVVGMLRVLLTMDTGQYEAAAKRTAAAAKAWSKDLGKIGQQATRVGQSLTAGITVPVVGVAAAALSAGVKFEQAMNAINGVLRPTEQQMERLRATAIKMGADTAFSATDAATAVLELGKAGFDTDTAIAAVGDTLTLAAASGLSMADSASMAARTLNAFGLEADDLGRVNDVLAKAVNATSLEINDMQIAFGYVGPIAQGFGMSIEEVSAALGIMRDNGIAAETTGRALREGFSRLANPVKSVRDVMAELGIQSFESNGKLMGLTEVVGLLQGKGITAAQSLKLFGDAAGPGMYALIKNGQQGLIDLTKQLQNSQGAAKAMADSMMQGLPGALERLRGSVETAWLSISKAIEPAVIRIADLVGNLADLITSRVAPAFMALPAPVQAGALGFIGLAAAVGPMLWMFGAMASGASNIVAAFAAGGIATRALAGAVSMATTYLPTFTAAASAMAARIALTGAALGAFSQVLTGLSIGVAFAASLFAGWTMGRFIGEVTGATDAVGKLTAKVGEYVGLLPAGAAAQYDASVAAGKAAEAARQAGSGLDEMARAAQALRDRVGGKGLAEDVVTLESEIRKLTAAGDLTPGAFKRIQSEVVMLQARGAELTDELKKYLPVVTSLKKPNDEAFDGLKKSLGGGEIIADVRRLAQAIREVGGITKLTADEQKRATGVIDDALAKYKALGKDVPPDILALAMRLQETASAATDASTGIELLGRGIENTGPKVSDIGEDLNTMNRALLGIGASRVATENLQTFKGAVKSSFEESAATARTSWAQAFQGVTQTLRMVQSSVEGTFAEMMLGAKSFSEGMGDIWDSIKAGAARAFTQILADFGGRFLRGMAGMMSGQQGAWGQAFAGMFSGAAGGGAGMSGVAQAGFGIGAGASGSGAGTAAGAGGAGAGAAVAGGAGAALAGWAAGRWGQDIFGGAGWKASGFGAAGGAAAGAAIGSVVPGLGTAAGAVIGGAAGAISGWVGVSKAVKEARTGVEQFQGKIRAVLTEEQRAEAGGVAWKETVIGVRDAYLATGRTAEEADDAVKRMWDTSHPERAVAAVMEIDKAMQEYALHLQEVEERQRNMEAATGIFDEIIQAGSNGIPASFKPTIDKLIETGLLTDEQIEKLRGLKEATIDTQAMESAIGVFKGRIDSLGPAFKQAKIAETAAGYVQALSTLKEGSADMGQVLVDAQEELQELFTEARKSGAKLPENLKPYYEELARTGRLVDENGQKIEDMSGIEWGPAMKTEAEVAKEGWDAIISKITELVDKITNKVGPAIDEVTRDREFDVDINVRANNGDNGYGRDDEERGHRVGTMGRWGTWFKNFGRGTRTTLHGPEAVVTQAQAIPFALDTLQSAMPNLGGQTGAAVAAGAGAMSARVELHVDGRRLAEAIVPVLPGAIRRHGVVV